jgi:hypothetical protein
MTVTVTMAPVVKRNRWRRTPDGRIEAQCPLCKQRQDLPHEIVDGFTEGAVICSMPHCYFVDWIRLEGWE